MSIEIHFFSHLTISFPISKSVLANSPKSSPQTTVPLQKDLQIVYQNQCLPIPYQNQFIQSAQIQSPKVQFCNQLPISIMGKTYKPYYSPILIKIGGDTTNYIFCNEIKKNFEIFNWKGKSDNCKDIKKRKERENGGCISITSVVLFLNVRCQFLNLRMKFKDPNSLLQFSLA